MKQRVGGWARTGTISVRKKLFALSALPVLIAGGLLLSLFYWGQKSITRAHENALTWERHAEALRHLHWAARFYFDSIADGLVHDPVPHASESDEMLAQAREEARALAGKFSPTEQAAEANLDAMLAAFVDQGKRVGKDARRLNDLEATFRNVISVKIRERVEEEERGSALALRAANQHSQAVRVGGIGIAVLLLSIAILASVVAVRGFGRRVASLERAAARVAHGQLDETVPVTSRDELGRLAGSLNVMIESLGQQRTRQLEFLSAVAHDLRNPLAPMRLAAEMLLAAPRLPPEPVVRKALGLLNRQIERLARMADDLVDATSIEAGKLKLSPRACDLVALTRDVIELYQGTSQHALSLSVPSEPVPTVCDPIRIAQVLDNLVSNAIKYSPDGGTVAVTVKADASEVVVSVTDTGIGIEPSMQDVIFEPFRRVSPSKDAVPGVGLGLSTSRRIVLGHGGRIDVASELGRGTTFSVHLPRMPLPEADRSSAGHENS